MKYTPHPYQLQAITHILQHPESALFLDMGLGKTVITLTALKSLLATGASEKVLIIAPKRVAVNTWPDEIRKWDHTRDLGYAMLTGNQTERLQALQSPAPINIINRENIPWLCSQLDTWPYDTVIIDELSSFKSASAKRFRSLKKQRPHIRRIIGLTGTPAPNSLIDLWAQYKLIDGGTALGNTLTAYRTRWFHPTKWVYGRPVQYQPNDQAETEIYQAIATTTLSMQAVDHLQLPAYTSINHPIELPKLAREKYDILKRHMILQLEDTEIDAANAAVLVSKLQQIANGAIYVNPTDPESAWYREKTPATETEVRQIHAAKLDALEDILEQTNGQPILVAYWFKHDRDRIRERFPQAKIIDSPESIQAWNQGETPLALIHPASAGHGLNLQAGGHYLCWYTPIWNLELYQQTNARLHRQGQKQPVTITHIIAANTIDERIMRRLHEKDHTQTNLIQALKEELA